MASIKFDKKSREWAMFTEFWMLCQKYWEPEQSDEWWEELIREANNFINKYGKDNIFVRGIALALMDYLEDKFKKVGGNLDT